ncbi:cell wall-binding repeat-containing protein [Herbiconiux sp. P15]|uniref:cell wall-binding repeat-containing protein n=1 Tax=Herbiconiux liukaitaii TaxID=3342799 RepID=UPI0035B9CFC6
MGDYPERVGPTGDFVIGSVPPGRYVLSVSIGLPAWDSYSTDWYYGDTPYHSNATVIDVVDQNVDGLQMTVPAGGSISGRLTDSAGGTVTDGLAQAYLLDPTTGFQTRATVWADIAPTGEYLLDGLAPGRWVVQFSQDSDRTPSLYGVSFAGGDDLASARVVDVVDGGAVAGVDGVLQEYRAAVVERIAGADRFDVSVAASKAGFAPGVEQVYVAGGSAWPDALSAGPAAAYHASPLLLVPQDRVPDAVAAEIARLEPSEIIVVGGPASVGSAVESQLAAIAPVVRVGGADRYEVSRALNLRAFGSTVDSGSMIAASGGTFADALSAGAVAADWRAPVLLVNGLEMQLDAPTRQYIFGSNVRGVTAIGGPATINEWILGELADFDRYDGPATRIGGADRFAVNRNLNAIDGYFAPPRLGDTAYLVSGLTFPDALSATTLAAQKDARVFLSAPNCVPAETLDTIRGLHVERIVLVGGPNTLGQGVADLTPC